MLVDLQRDYLDSRGIEPAVGSILDRAGLLLQGCRDRGIPVAHVWTTVHRNPDNRMPHWKRTDRWSCEAGTPGHAAPAALAPQAQELVISKRSFSAFAGTDVASMLRERGIDVIVLAGVHLHACIRQTALDAYQAGFDVWIADDAVGSDDPVHAAITRRYLEARAITFAPADAILGRLEKGAAAPPAAAPCDGLNDAVAAAAALTDSWARTDRPQRRNLVALLRETLSQQAEACATLITRDIGKPLRHSRDEMRCTLNMIDAVADRAICEPDVDLREGARLRRRPHGVVAVVTPCNNPAYISLGKIVPAILHGNTVVWKPAPETQATSARIFELITSANWPRGLVSLVEGGRREAQALLADARVAAATMTGSLDAGASVQEVCARRRIPLQAELGGNNAAIVWPDADLRLAATEVAAGAFEMAGQRCTATRRVIVHRDCREQFLKMLDSAAAALSWGDPRLESTDIGPLVSPVHCRRVSSAVQRAIADGALARCPLGREAPRCGDFAGAWHPPTIIECDEPGNEIVQEETFGPVLVVQTADDWERAMRLCNGVRHGLAAAIFARSREVVERFLAEAQAGILKINRSTAGAAVDAPFGGWKASGIGPPEHGEFDLAFYTRPQSVYGNLT